MWAVSRKRNNPDTAYKMIQYLSRSRDTYLEVAEPVLTDSLAKPSKYFKICSHISNKLLKMHLFSDTISKAVN